MAPAEMIAELVEAPGNGNRFLESADHEHLRVKGSGAAFAFFSFVTVQCMGKETELMVCSGLARLVQKLRP